MFDGGSGNLLQKLSTAHQLGQTNATPTQLSERATRDGTRAHVARTQAIKAAATAAQIPVASKRAAMDAAQADVDAAQSALDTARSRLAATTPTLDIPAFDSSGLLSGSAWVDPVRGPITDRFGPRPSQPLGTSLFHPGDDIGAACLSWIGAASAGTVVATGPFSGYGNWVVIDHGDGVQTVYGHIVDGGTAVSVGQQVLAGQPIARVGSTGLSTGCHLHLEVRVNGQQIDPMPFFAIRGVVIGG
jgi:murein DD-endopeptidase MepM/ murein hydrolase activator NlpD